MKRIIPQRVAKMIKLRLNSLIFSPSRASEPPTRPVVEQSLTRLGEVVKLLSRSLIILAVLCEIILFIDW